MRLPKCGRLVVSPTRLVSALAAPGVSRRINSQYLHKLCDLSQMTQRIARRFVISTKDVHKENLLPRMAAQGARFDLTEIDIAQGKDAECLEEYPGYILQSETNRSFVSAFAYLFRFTD